MEKNIFDKQFVYFMWDDSLKGKKCFVADEVDLLEQRVENNAIDSFYTVKSHSTSLHYPFCIDLSKQNAEYDNTADYRFVYYDPLYDIKWAWKQGACIQCRCHSGAWLDASTPDWDNKALEFRVKPVSAYRPFKSTQELKSTFLALTNQTAIPANFEPVIWVRSKANTQCTRMITGFADSSNILDDAIVWIGTSTIYMYALLKEWEFLDGTPCGVKEE